MFGNYEGYEGGGFDVSGFENTETVQDGKKGPKRADNLVPVTARQVINSSDNSLKIGLTDMEAQMVKLVGVLKNINRTSVKIIYKLEDNTGLIEGVHWLDADTDDNFVIPVVENTYCTMIGSIRNTTAQHNERHIMVFKIFSVTDLNEITAHALEIIYIALRSEDLAQQAPVPETKLEMTSTYGNMDTSSGDNLGYAAGFNLNPQQQRVLKAVAQNCLSESGAGIETIMKSLTVKMPLKDVEKILEFLSSEGHIYSTSDDKHYKATDAEN